jgi:excisionase family DNA binding protein
MPKRKPTTEDRTLTLSIDEAAVALNISRSSCYAAARRHELPIVKIGNRLLVSRVGLEQMLREAMPKATNDDERVGR